MGALFCFIFFKLKKPILALNGSVKFHRASGFYEQQTPAVILYTVELSLYLVSLYVLIVAFHDYVADTR
jgi:hypothetical protein